MPASPPGRVVALIALVVLALGVGLAFRGYFRGLPVRRSTPVVVSEPAGEDPVQRALRLAAIDTTQKNRWVDDVPGADVSALAPARRAVFVRFANAERCTCGCGFTLAGCRRFDATCEVSLPRVTRLLDSVATGRITSAAGIRQRPAGMP